MKTIMIILIFLLIGAFFIIAQENLNLTENDSRAQFVKEYVSWFGDLFNNSKQVTSYVIKMDWLPD